MAPKNKGKKSKKQDDDEFWDQVGESVGGNNVGTGDDIEDDAPRANTKSAFSAAAFGVEDMMDGGGEDEDFGGLMSALKSTGKSKKDKKKAKKAGWDENEGEDAAPPPADDGDGDAAPPSKAPVEVTAEDLADEEWGPVKEKKGKKGKKGKKAAKDEPEEDEEKPTDTAAPSAPVTAETLSWPPAAGNGEDEAEAADDGGGTKILSKKEKEKLKKEKEKAKKKAQAAAKKTTATEDVGAEEIAAADSKPDVTVQADDVDDADDVGEGGPASKNKKKKKKSKKDDEPVPAPAPASDKKKKAGGGISALKAMMEERKRLEEEARKVEEERLRKIEEEERRIEEEARRKEEEKQRKKEKEKAKVELAKKEGRYLTKKQKEDQRLAELRKQALLASGVQVEGLQASGGSGGGKKVVYGNRKKDSKKPTAADSKDASPAPSSPATPVVSNKDLPAPDPAPTPQEEKDEWDASSEDDVAATAAKPDVKDDWDASSGDEEAAKPAAATPTKASKPAKAEPAKDVHSKAAITKGGKANGAAEKPSPTSTAQASAKPAAAKATPAKAAVEEESEEEDSDEEDSDEDSDSDSDSDSDEESSDEDGLTATQRAAAKRKAEAAERRAKAHEAALATRSKDNLRSPICCILGHVDTGKTKLLDKIRQTNVQEGEAGGITQQIGATFFPVDAIKQKTAVLNKDGNLQYNIPGLLVIDTPGHESFTNLRTRGSSLCNIAILVVDIMHGLEPQTLESLRLLRDRKTPFIVALNKIDRMYGWEAIPDNSFQDSLEKQKKSVQREFEDRVQRTITAFAEQGLNAVLYYDNKNFAKNVSLVPTSAITGEGVPDMIMLLVNLTQQRMNERLMYISSLECTVLEVKVIEGLGTTIDVVLVNGYLREGDKIVVCGLNGAIVTQVRALLTPQPLRELRIKSQYVHHKEVRAALGVKISAPDLEKAIAGSRLLVCGPDDDEDDLREEVMSDLTSLLSFIDKSGKGVSVQASTLGSLEALLDFLKVSKIPVSGINIGPVHKKDIMRCATMLERARELAVILCFDVSVDKDAERMADELGIRVFKADIIYHLFDAFTAYNAEIMEAKRRDAAPQAIWPCRLKTIACFAKRDPIILGVDILDGSLRVGTPLCVVKVDPVTQKREIIDLGKITSLEINHKAMDVVKKSQAGGGVAVKIEHAVYQSAKMFGRHFDDKDEIVAHITRQSIDVLKATFKADVSNEEWLLIKALKPRLGVQ